MSNVLIHDSADKVPSPPAGRHPLAPISYADAPRSAGLRPPAQVWLILTLMALAPVGLALYAAWQAVASLLLDWPWLAPAFGLLLVSVGVVLVIALPFGLLMRGWLAMQQARIVRTRHGVPVDVVQQMRIDPLTLEAQAVQLEALKAPYTIHPNLSTLSAPHAPGASAPPQLAAPDAGIAPVPSSTWLHWIGQTPHVMLAAETGGGKTTLALWLLASRLGAGEQAFIIDPHASAWGGLASVGAGEDWAAVGQAMQAVIALYAQRQQARARALIDRHIELPSDHFGRLTVVLDEAYLTKSALDTGKASIWRQFVPILGSGARKIGMSCVLITQTANVEDIGLSAPLRENYTRIALDASAIRKLIVAEEPSKARRDALMAAIGGVAWPAATERYGQIEILDRSDLAETPDLSRYADRIWQPGPCPARPTPDQALRRAVRAAQARGWTRDQARQAGLRFDNGLWSALADDAAEQA